MKRKEFEILEIRTLEEYKLALERTLKRQRRTYKIIQTTNIIFMIVVLIFIIKTIIEMI